MCWVAAVLTVSSSAVCCGVCAHGGHENGTVIDRISVLVEEPPECSPDPHARQMRREKYAAGRRALIPGFQRPELWEAHLCISHSVYDMLLQRLEWTKLWTRSHTLERQSPNLSLGHWHPHPCLTPLCFSSSFIIIFSFCLLGWFVSLLALQVSEKIMNTLENFGSSGGGQRLLCHVLLFIELYKYSILRTNC